MLSRQFARLTQPEDASLSSQLDARMIKSQFDKTPFRFVAHSDLEEILTDAAIRKALSIHLPSPAEKLSLEFVKGKARKVFAITAYMTPDYLDVSQLHRAVSFFHRSGFDDSKLPIREVQLKELGAEADQSFEKLVAGLSRDEVERRLEELSTKAVDSVKHPLISSEAPVSVEHARIWTTRRILKFQEFQNRFLAPILSDAESNHDLYGLTLPFVNNHHTYAAGSFGEVSKYSIHESHMLSAKRPDGVSYQAFAVKHIKPDNANDRKKVADHWASEVVAMEMMNRLDHKGHIVHFITAFRWESAMEKEHYLITEWADGGNLHNLWSERKKPTLNAATVKSVIGQLLGIAEAFNAAHNLKSGGITTGASYRHGDLKPANILWFKPKSGDPNDIGTLKICDWGEAKQNDRATVMRHSRTTAEFGTTRYQPPEVGTGLGSITLGGADKRRSRLYDIWAVGCITLEFVVWLLYGFDGLEEFNKGVKNELGHESPFYQIRDDGNRKVAWVHNVVEHWMGHIAQDKACRVGTTALGDLLEVVQGGPAGGLLVVNLPRAGGTFYHQDGITPGTLAQPRQLGSSMEVAMPSGKISTVENPTFRIDPAAEDESDIIPLSSTGGPSRLRADQLRDRLSDISSTDETGYWSMQSDTTIPVVPRGLFAMPPNIDRVTKVQQSQVDYGKGEIDPHKWKFAKDNDFAFELFSTFQRNAVQFPIPTHRTTGRLCSLCRDFRDRIWNPVFTIEYNVHDLRERATSNQCDLCKLLWSTCIHKSGEWYKLFPEVSFQRSIGFDSALSMNGNRLPVLSICRGLDKCPKTEDLQTGFAELPKAGGPAHFEILRQWLQDCDDNHDCCKLEPDLEKSADRDAPRLPTRLLKVGKAGEPSVSLWETGATDKGEWLALSHRWGEKPHFSTTTENREDHLRGIALRDLPSTFRDAVEVTRALNCDYLWIDSICIVQSGEDADFNKEAKRMEEVYSGARCVLAASRAGSHHDGFLKPRLKRSYVGLQRERGTETPFYICTMIDNFKEHILDGDLNKRGWVLQEHALARRTIFFADHQTYWECGHGVRCETMTTLQNDWAKLLGDPSFPQVLDKAQQGERISRFQGLYEDYSRFGLSEPHDRPSAIAGLEQRLLRTMKVQGKFGMFDDPRAMGLLRRSLLWHRGKHIPSLERITFSGDHAAVPSWSWMAWQGGKNITGQPYPGGINYFELPYDQFSWESLQPPWSESASGQDNVLVAEAQTFDREEAEKGGGRFIDDSPGKYVASMCVVLGVQSSPFEPKERKNYVLLIAKKKEPRPSKETLWERVGAGFLLGRHLRKDHRSVRIC